MENSEKTISFLLHFNIGVISFFVPRDVTYIDPQSSDLIFLKYYRGMFYGGSRESFLFSLCGLTRFPEMSQKTDLAMNPTSREHL